jgi:hypothetical protein
MLQAVSGAQVLDRQRLGRLKQIAVREGAVQGQEPRVRANRAKDQEDRSREEPAPTVTVRTDYQARSYTVEATRSDTPSVSGTRTGDKAPASRLAGTQATCHQRSWIRSNIWQDEEVADPTHQVFGEVTRLVHPVLEEVAGLMHRERAHFWIRSRTRLGNRPFKAS